ncbi:DUF3006 domain-containing protein [Neobacillus sp. D3-1R]|uniref:DUF3006 domain-containing protein n=1 Tax=Neobacillus sp. D3-1R TaxID=3445778 RepID=UPI003FA101A8
MQNNSQDVAEIFGQAIYTIDRFEGEVAVLLLRSDETMELNVPRTILPDEVTKGSILQVDVKNGKIKSVTYLKEETEKVRRKNKELLQKLINTHPSL